jgi:hypothetical protein
MAKETDLGFGTDTAIDGSPSLTFSRGELNFAADFSVVKQSSGSILLANLNSDRDRVENIRFEAKPIKDVYANSGINASVQSANKAGMSVLVQVTDTLSVTDDADATFRVDAPVSLHMVLKVPACAELTEAHVLTYTGRLVSALFETGSNDESRLKALLRGSLTPADV